MTETILITGAGSGIGRATARLFLENGWNVGLIGRREAALAETAEGAARAMLLPCDVSDADAIGGAVTELAAAFGRLDVLFNNAGISLPTAMIDEIPVEDWLALANVNITGMFLTARAAFAQMRAQAPQGGRIINNGSVSAQVPRFGSAAYTMSKHAVTGLTRSLSLDGRGFDIACGQIDIGNAMTDMAEKMTRGVPQADGALKIEPVMPATEVARAVWHMATLPPGTNVQFMTVMATAMPYIGRG